MRSYTLREKRTAALIAASAINTIIDGQPAKLTAGMKSALVDIVDALKRKAEGSKIPIDVLEILTSRPAGIATNEHVIDLTDYGPGEGDYADEAAMPTGLGDTPESMQPCEFCGFPVFICSCDLGRMTRGGK